VNDAPHLAPALGDLAAEVGAFVNLIPFNPIANQDWKPSPPNRLEHFRTVLEGRGVAVAIREPRGRDIDAACGQLRTKELVSLGEAPSAPPGSRTDNAT
jgi:23S rRNA (adenine2503-C2)-methyltransferase